jgi:(2Fe-2S) ferredoxin
MAERSDAETLGGFPPPPAKDSAGRSPASSAPHLEKHVFICVNRRDPGNPKGSCAEKGSEAVRDEFKRLLHERGVKGRMRANAAGCLDQCARGVTVVVYPEQVWYGGVTVADVPEIIDSHLFGGVPVERLRMK